VATAATILVIEDQRDNMDLIDYLLRAHGYAPRLALTGTDGLRLALEAPPDLILMDLRMPGMDGYEVAAAIKDRAGFQRTRIVAVTASAMVEDRDRINAAGFHGYIQKPIDPETFIATIQQFLPSWPEPIGV